MKHVDITTIDELKEALYHSHASNFIFRSLDFTHLETKAMQVEFSNCIFAGCTMSDALRNKIEDDNLVFPKLKIPFRIPKHLYTARDLYDSYKMGQPESFHSTYDQRLFRRYRAHGKEINADTDIRESMARSIHDHTISDFLHDFLEGYDEKKIIGIMGGHGILRTGQSFPRVARVAKTLTEMGYLMISGGGPGAMEATHLGAWMAGRTDEELQDAVEMLKVAPRYDDELWLDSAFQVMEKYPQTKYFSLGIPTFVYGHEPATVFATHIAKYFDNSIREDKILTVAKGGIIYTPGSAGTMQEIFQDANQNHYMSYGYSSPMVFMGRDYWTNEMPVIPLFERMMENGRYKNLLISLVDDDKEAVDCILSFLGKAQ